jgi:hypothetical protein
LLHRRAPYASTVSSRYLGAVELVSTVSRIGAERTKMPVEAANGLGAGLNYA